jgi:hypothetical protein
VKLLLSFTPPQKEVITVKVEGRLTPEELAAQNIITPEFEGLCLYRCLCFLSHAHLSFLHHLGLVLLLWLLSSHTVPVVTMLLHRSMDLTYLPPLILLSEIVVLEEDPAFYGHKMHRMLNTVHTVYDGTTDAMLEMHGHGRSEIVDGKDKGDVYTGTFIHGQREGYGVLKFKGIETEYTGQIQRGRGHGIGRVISQISNLNIIAEFTDASTSGFGIKRPLNGEGFTAGELKPQYINHGYGYSQSRNGKLLMSFQGQWVDDWRHGFGVESHKHGSLVGMWKEGKPVGHMLRIEGDKRTVVQCLEDFNTIEFRDPALLAQVEASFLRLYQVFVCVCLSVCL